MTRKEYCKIYGRWYRLAQRGKEAHQRYRRSPKGKLNAQRCNARYQAKLKRRKKVGTR